MKLAIIVGHNSKAQGAVRVTDGVTEYSWNSALAEEIEALGPDVRIFYRTKGGGYSAEIDRVYSEVNDWGATASVELHFNAASDERVAGCETLSSGSSGSTVLCEALQARMVAVMGGRDRGVKVVSKDDRGGRSLWAGKAPAALIEPYFGSNPDSCDLADAKSKELAKAIYEAAKTV